MQEAAVKQDDGVRLRRQAATIMRMDVEPSDMSEVRTVVRGHMVPGIYLTSNFRDEQVITMWLTDFVYPIVYIGFVFPAAAGNGK